VAGLHDTLIPCLEWNSGDRARGHVEVILKDYPSDTIRISLSLDGGWGKDKKKIKKYCLLVCAGMENSTITRSQKMLYRSYPSRTNTETNNQMESSISLSSCNFRPIPWE